MARREAILAEVAKHNKDADVWIVVKGKVYDCTKYMANHPGGPESIMINAGVDSTEDFEAIHSQKAWKQLEEWYIGDVDPNSAPASAKAMSCSLL